MEPIISKKPTEETEQTNVKIKNNFVRILRPFRQGAVVETVIADPYYPRVCRGQKQRKLTVTRLKVDIDIDSSNGVSVSITHFIFPIDTVVQKIRNMEFFGGDHVITAISRKAD